MAKQKRRKKNIPSRLRPPVGADLDLDTAVKQQPAWLQQELVSVRKYEDKIVEALKDEANTELFTRDPGMLLKKLDIPMSGAFRKRLQADQSLDLLKKSHCFKLPNGHVIKPNIRIRFTRKES